MKHGDPSSGLLALRHGECAVLEIVIVKLLGHHQWEYLGLQLVGQLLPRNLQIFKFISVLKNILFCRMPVEVQVQEKLLLVNIHYIFAEFLCVVNCGMELLAWLQPFSVEVTGGQGASVVSVYYAVYIQHRYDIDFEIIFQVLHEFLFFIG